MIILRFLLIFVGLLQLSSSFSQIDQVDVSGNDLDSNAMCFYNVYGFDILHDNDLLNFFANNKDDNYTGGLHMRLLTSDRRFTYGLPWLKKSEIAQQFHNIGIGNTAFTPQDLSQPSVIENDRPYASFQFFSYSVLTVPRNLNSRTSLEINLGVMGK